MNDDRPYSVTINYQGITHLLTLPLRAWPDTGSKDPPPNFEPKEYKAILDTGATRTYISKEVVNQLSLEPHRSWETMGGLDDSPQKTPVFRLTLDLPNGIIVGIEAGLAEAIKHADIVIGMDIITMGDFAISNFGGQTALSFRMPSIERIDFASSDPPVPRPPGGVFMPKANSAARSTGDSTNRKIGRNAPCPCGSGKKYKKCCGAEKK